MIEQEGKNKKEVVGNAVLKIYESNVGHYTNKYKLTPQVAKATVVTYLFSLWPSLYQGHTINLRMESKGNRKFYVVFSIAARNGTAVERICPVICEADVELLRHIFNFEMDNSTTLKFSSEVIDTGKLHLGNTLSTLHKQVHRDALAIFEELKIPIEKEDEHKAIKALRDLRIADSVINQGIDYGFIRTMGLGLGRHKFFEDNMFKAEIEEFFKRNIGQRAQFKYAYM